MWTRFLIVSFILAADLGSVWESTADAGETERLLSDAQFVSPVAIAANSDNAPPGVTVVGDKQMSRCRVQAPGRMRACNTVVRNPSLADPYFSRAPPALA